jgi:hypothetical protein
MSLTQTLYGNKQSLKARTSPGSGTGGGAKGGGPPTPPPVAPLGALPATGGLRAGLAEALGTAAGPAVVPPLTPSVPPPPPAAVLLKVPPAGLGLLGEGKAATDWVLPTGPLLTCPAPAPVGAPIPFPPIRGDACAAGAPVVIADEGVCEGAVLAAEGEEGSSRAA